MRISYNVSDAQLRITHALLDNNVGITGKTILYSVQRLSDGYFWDFTANEWQASPGDINDTLTQADATKLPGLYSKTFDANSGLVTTLEYRVRKWIAAGIYAFDAYDEFYPTDDLSAAGVAAAVWGATAASYISSGTFGEIIMLIYSGTVSKWHIYNDAGDSNKLKMDFHNYAGAIVKTVLVKNPNGDPITTLLNTGAIAERV
jgi:hypothetical protein